LEETPLSTYDAESPQAKIGDEFSKQTLLEIQEFFPTAKHAEGVVPEYDIVIPIEEYGFPKIECKVCGVTKDLDNKQYVKIPKALFEISESKYVRIKFKSYYNGYSECYYRLSSLKKYLDKMMISNNVKVIQQENREIILWPLHLLDGMFTKMKTTNELIDNIKKNKK